MLHTIRVWVFGCNVNVRLQEEGFTQRYLIIEKLRADRFYFFGWMISERWKVTRREFPPLPRRPDEVTAMSYGRCH